MLVIRFAYSAFQEAPIRRARLLECKFIRILVDHSSNVYYTCRIHKVGLLPRCNHQQVPFAYNMYSRDDDEGWRQSNAFKKAFSINVEIEFVGVW